MKLKRDKTYRLLKVESDYTFTIKGVEIQNYNIDMVFIATSYLAGRVLMVNENPYHKNGSNVYFSSSELKKYRKEGKLIKL